MIDWNKVSRSPNLSIEFLRNNKYNLIWRLVQRNTVLTDEMIAEFAEYIDWHLYHIMQPDFVSEGTRENN